MPKVLVEMRGHEPDSGRWFCVPAMNQDNSVRSIASLHLSRRHQAPDIIVLIAVAIGRVAAGVAI